MKKRYICSALPLAFLLVLSSANAEWRKLSSSDDGSTQYFESGSLERIGTTAKLTWLNDKSTPSYVRRRKSSKTWSSQVIQAEYNCAAREYRIVTNTLYEGQMGTGEVFESSSLSKWRDISDGFEMWRTTFAAACNR